MNASTGLRFLRPYLATELPITSRSAYIRFFHSTKCLGRSPVALKRVEATENIYSGVGCRKKPAANAADVAKFSPRHEVEERMKELNHSNALVYPRISSHSSGSSMSISEYTDRFKHLKVGEMQEDFIVTIRGRVSSTRIAGKALVFLDVYQEGCFLQGVCNGQRLGSWNGTTPEEFRQFSRLLRRGDVISITGWPYRTKSGELSINAIEVPTTLSPSLASLPRSLESQSTRMKNRHVDLLINKRTADTLRARSHIIQQMRRFLLDLNFLEVQTPIIGDSAGGAIARPFTTVATEWSDKELTLRIAPEIWLKRLILGGMDRIFEIGPAFRNEGLDTTHNPEFTTCEFYQSFSSLEDLIGMTEQMILGLVDHVKLLRETTLHALPELSLGLGSVPFKRLQFIPAIEERLGEELPNLAADNAAERLVEIFIHHGISIPASQTLPRLLDKLCSIYIEPQCDEPTFITHHPACMAPLAKSFIDPTTTQDVSARAELFIQQKEIANMYEEENSPFEQRSKFVQQARYKDDENKAFLDESYLEALEWGLPPTGGWGCGIDRLCMLLTGSSRISDVLAFGSLKNVVNLGHKTPTSLIEEKKKKEKEKGEQEAEDI